MVKEKMKQYKGKVVIRNNTTGQVFTFTNIVCNTFYDMVADFFIGTSPDKLSHLAIGTGLTPVAVTDTAMETEVIRLPFTTTATSSDQMHIEVEVDGATALFNWKELGLFNAASSGDMTNHVNIDYTHNAGEIATINWYIEKA